MVSFERWPTRLITRCFTDQGYGPTFSISRSWLDSSSISVERRR